MKLIIISGPSGSGKTTLSKQILKKMKDGIILNTDNYYKTGIISLILSKLITSYFDRKLSFNFNIFKKDLDFILKNGFSNFNYIYDFKRKSVQKIYKKTKNIRFVIVEGIFGKEVLRTASKKNCILIKLKTSKQICMKRVIKRDFIERGKNKNLAYKDFLKAWKLFHKKETDYQSRNYLKEIVITKKVDMNLLIKDVINITN